MSSANSRLEVGSWELHYIEISNTCLNLSFAFVFHHGNPFMFEFRGWAVLCFHSHDIDKRLQEAGFQKPLQCFFEMNMQDFVNVQHESGFDSLSVSGLFNHRSALIIDIFRKIAGIMPGFYELLYIRNDEDDKDKTDHSNEFVVWKLTRGNSNQEKDPFLSPCIT